MKVKVDKASVNYSKGMDGRFCSVCRFFIPASACVRVKGMIDPGYWCELFFKRKRKK